MNVLALEGKLEGARAQRGERERNHDRGARARRSWRASVTPPRASHHAPARPGDLERSVLNPALAERALGSLTELTAGLAATHEYYSEMKRALDYLRLCVLASRPRARSRPRWGFDFRLRQSRRSRSP